MCLNADDARLASATDIFFFLYVKTMRKSSSFGGLHRNNRTELESSNGALAIDRPSSGCSTSHPSDVTPPDDLSVRTVNSAGTRRRRLWKSFKSWHLQRSVSSSQLQSSASRYAVGETTTVPSTCQHDASQLNIMSSEQKQLHSLEHSPSVCDEGCYSLSYLESDTGTGIQTGGNIPGIPLKISNSTSTAITSSVSCTDIETQTLQSKENPLHVYRCHPFFVLDVILKDGRDLVVRDSCGTSDPYVIFRIGGKQCYRSRTIFKNLNPNWNERFSIPVEDPQKPINILVFDYDRGLNDDSMGSTSLQATRLDIAVPTELRLMLRDESHRNKSMEYMGYITVQCTLQPKTMTDREHYVSHMTKLLEQSKRLRTPMWTSVVNIVLIDGHELLPMDDNVLSNPYVKFRLGNERYKSKYKTKTLSPKWLEQFDIYLFDDQTSYLEVSVWDHGAGGRDELMGRAELDLTQFDKERTHDVELNLEDSAGYIRLFLSISDIASYYTVTDSSGHENLSRSEIIKQYDLLHSFKKFCDVGRLFVRVIRAQGVMAADIGGKSDPFCVLELVNTHLQTRTEYKTLTPEWNKLFVLDVPDIHSVLEVTVFDEDRGKKCDFLGKVAIPLLKIKNGHQRWYQLKDQKLMCRTKGAILLELDFMYNQLKAVIRTFNPREEKLIRREEKFRVSVMKNNIDRVRLMFDSFMSVIRFINSCFEWHNKFRSILAFIVFLIVVWNFELYMLPLSLFILFIKNLLFVRVGDSLLKNTTIDHYILAETKEAEDERENKDEKKSFKEKLHAVQEACLQVQEIMDYIACLGERAKNSFLWTVPWLSWLAVVVLMVASVILYFIPLRFLVLAWGINKFTKKLRAPDSIPNNEVLDYLSRVPSDKELVQYRELRPDPVAIVPRKRQQFD